MNLFVLLILAVFASEKKEKDPENEERYENNSILVKIEDDEYVKLNKKSTYIGVIYNKYNSKWRVQRYSKYDSKAVYNGYYDNEKTAAHASDTLARKLMKNGEQTHKLNFPDDRTEIYPEKSSKHIGLSYDKNVSKWYAQRRSKTDKKLFSNGYYDDEETAARASDTLARKLMKNGEKGHKLNFPDDHIEVHPEKTTTSKYNGVSYHEKNLNWYVRRWSKSENKHLFNGCYDVEETAAHASDTLARKLMENGEQGHKLNFPDDHTEVYPTANHKKKRKRSKGLNLADPQIN